MDRPQMAAKHQWSFFFFWHLLLHSLYYIHKAGKERGTCCKPDSISWSVQQLPTPAIALLFGLPLQCTTTRQNLQLSHRRLHEAWHMLKTRRRLRHDYVTTLQQPLGTNGFFKFHRYVLQPHRYNDLYTMTLDFFFKLGWWWCCCQCSPMYIM